MARFGGSDPTGASVNDERSNADYTYVNTQEGSYYQGGANAPDYSQDNGNGGWTGNEGYGVSDLSGSVNMPGVTLAELAARRGGDLAGRSGKYLLDSAPVSAAMSALERYSALGSDLIREPISQFWLFTNPLQKGTFLDFNASRSASQYTSAGEAMALNPFATLNPMYSKYWFEEAMNMTNVSTPEGHEMAFPKDKIDWGSGITDVGVQTVLDPLVVAGKVAKAGKLAYLGRGILDGADMAKMESQLSALVDNGVYDPAKFELHGFAERAMGESSPSIISRFSPTRRAARKVENTVTERTPVSERDLVPQLEDTIDPTRRSLTASEGSGSPADELLTTVRDRLDIKTRLTSSGWAVDELMVDPAGTIIGERPIGYRLTRDGTLIKSELDANGIPAMKQEPLSVKLGADPVFSPDLQVADLNDSVVKVVTTKKADAASLMNTDVVTGAKGYEKEAAQFLADADSKDDFVVRTMYLMGSKRAKELMFEKNPVIAAQIDHAESVAGRLQQELSILAKGDKKGWSRDPLTGEFAFDRPLTAAERAAIPRTADDYKLQFKIVDQLQKEWGGEVRQLRELWGASPEGGRIYGLAGNRGTRMANRVDRQITGADTYWFRPGGMTGATIGIVKRTVDDLPDHYVPTKGAQQVDAANAVRAIIRDNPRYTNYGVRNRDAVRSVRRWSDGTEMSGVERGRYLYNEFIRRSSQGGNIDVAHADATRWLDNTMWNDMVEAKGLTTEQAAWVRGQYTAVRQAHSAARTTTDGQKFFTSVDPHTGEPIHWDDPHFASQLANGYTVLDYKQLDEIMDSSAFYTAMAKDMPRGKRAAEVAGGVKDIATNAGDAIMNVWKPLVLLRPFAYPARNVFEGQTRFLAASGGILNYLEAIGTGRAGRATKSAARARSAREVVQRQMDDLDAGTTASLDVLDNVTEIPGELKALISARRDIIDRIGILTGRSNRTFLPYDHIDDVSYDPAVVFAKALDNGATGMAPIKAILPVESRPIYGDKVVEYADNLEQRVGFERPIQIGLNPDTGEVRLVDGMQRLIAAQSAGMSHVPIRLVVDRNPTGSLIRTAQKGKLQKDLAAQKGLKPEAEVPYFQIDHQVENGTPLDATLAFRGQRWTGKGVQQWTDEAAKAAQKRMAGDWDYTYNFRAAIADRINLEGARLDKVDKRTQAILTKMEFIDPATGEVAQDWAKAFPHLGVPQREALANWANTIDAKNALRAHAADLDEQIKLYDLAGKKRLRRGEGFDQHQVGEHTYNYGGVYSDPRAGDMVRAAVSAEGTTANFVASGQRAYGKALRHYKITSNDVVEPTHPQYWDALAEFANHNFRGEPVMRMILEADPLRPSTRSADFIRFLKTPEGAKYKEMFGLYTRADAHRQFNQWARHVNNLIPNGEARAMLARGDEVTPELLKESIVPLEGGLRPVVGNIREELPGVLSKGGVGRLLGNMRDWAFKWIGTKPEDYFTRMPYANYRYSQHMRKWLDRVGADGQEIPVAEVEQARRQAAKAAISDTRKDMYTIMRKKRVFESIRLVSAFAEAQYNSIAFWSRTLLQNPAYIGRLMQMASLPAENGLVDREGNVSIPVPTLFTDHLAGMPTNVTISPQALTSLWFNTGNDENPVLGGMFPGPSPITAVSASEFAKTPWGHDFVGWSANKEGWLGHLSRAMVNQYMGDQPSSVIGSLDKSAPAWVQKAVHLAVDANGGNDTYMRQMQTEAWMTDHIRWMTNGGQGPMPAITDEKYKSSAQGMALLRIAVNLGSPIGFQFQNRDQKMAVDVYRGVQKEYGAKASQVMLQQFPELVSALSSPRDAAKIPGTFDSNKYIRNNKDILKDLASLDPMAARLLVPFDGGEFNMTAYRWQETNKIPGQGEHWRQVNSPEEQRKRFEENIGSTLRMIRREQMYTYAEQIGLKPGTPGFKEMKAKLNDYTEQLKNEYPGFKDKWISSSGGAEKGLDVFRAIVGNEKFSSNPENATLVDSINRYAAIRDRYVDAVAKSEKWWNAAPNAALKDAYETEVDGLERNDARFSRLFGNYFFLDQMERKFNG